MHRFADEIFAQDRPERGATIAAARERRSSGAFQLDVASPAVAVQRLAQQDGAAVAEPGNEVAELMSGIGHRDRLGARRHWLPANVADSPSGPTPRVSMPNSEARASLNLISRGLGHRRRSEPREETLGQARVAVGKRSGQGRHSFDSGWFLNGISGEHPQQIPFSTQRRGPRLPPDRWVAESGR